ncbi:MAG: GNAT family N-acetyltransferase [Candidatus Aminicenantes bacterium]|jgi:CelD/BcsL family acetyltransferase involved in cellulose biosynthesis
MKVDRITEFDRFLEAEEEWNSLLDASGLDCVFLTHEWFRTFWECLSGKNSLEVLLFKDERDHICGAAPMMADGRNLRFIASHEVTDYCDFLYLEEHKEEFFESLLRYLGENYPDRSNMEFINIRSSSSTCGLIPQLASTYGFAHSLNETEVAPVLSVPSTYGDYMKSLKRKNRHEIRRKLKRLERLEGIKVKKITETRHLLPAVKNFISLHAQSSPQKQAFWTTEGMPDFFTQIVHRFSQNGWVEMNVLFFENSLISALLNFLYSDEVLFYNVAYDQDYAPFSPGFYLFHASIVEAISRGKSRVDFLRGREKYKYDFGAKECKIYSLILKRGESAG